MSIRKVKERVEESGWKVNRLLQLLKKPEKFSETPEEEARALPEAAPQPESQPQPAVEPQAAAAEQSEQAVQARPEEAPARPAQQLAAAESATLDTRRLRENYQPLEVAYKGDLKPGGLITLYLFVENKSDGAWQGISLKGELFKGFSYVPETTTCNGESLEDAEGTSPIFTSSGSWIPFIEMKEKRTFSMQLMADASLNEGALLKTHFSIERDGGILARAEGVACLQGAPAFSDAGCTLSSEPAEHASPGQLVSYTLSLANTGKSQATHVFAAVKKLDHAVYLPGTAALNGDHVLEPLQGGALFTGQGLYVGSIPPGEKSVVTFQAKVDYPLDQGELIAAACEVRSDQTGSLELEPSKLKVQSAPRFMIGQDTYLAASADGSVKPNEVVTYEIHYRNSGNSNAYGMTALVKASPIFEMVPGSLSVEGLEAVYQEKLLFTSGFPLGTVAPGQQGKLSFQMKIRFPAENGARAELKASISYQPGEEEALPSVVHVVESKPFFADPKLCWLEVYPKGHVEPNTLLTYTLHFKNEGSAAHAYNVKTRVRIPKEITYVPGSLAHNGKKLEAPEAVASFFSPKGFHIDKVAFGADNRITFQAKVNTQQNGTPLDAIAEIEAEGTKPYATLPISGTVSAKPNFAQGAENYVEVSPQKEVSPGEMVTYTVHFKNKGPVHARQVLLAGEEPMHTRYIPNKTKLNGIPVSDEEKNSPIFSPKGLDLGTLYVGDQGTLSFQVKVNAPLEKGTPIQGQIRINADNLATYALELPPLTVRSFADFANAETNFMEVFPEGSIAPGQPLTYVLYYKNNGNDSAKRVTLRADCPPGAVYVKGSTRLNGITVPDIKGFSPLFGKGLDIDDLKWNGSGNVSFQVKAEETAEPGTILTMSGSIEWDERVFRTNTARNPVKSFVDFSNKKQNQLTVSPEGEIVPGTLITYTARYKNEGTIPAGQASLKLTLSPHVQYIPNSTVLDGQPVTDSQGMSTAVEEQGLSLGGIAPGAAGEVSLRCLVTNPLDAGTVISADAKLRYNQGQTFDFETAKSQVRSSPRFSDKAFNYIEAVEDQKSAGAITFVVNFKNTGDSNAHDVAFKGKLPSGCKYVPGSTRLNGRAVKEGESSPIFGDEGLIVSRVDAEEEGNFSFRVVPSARKKALPLPSVSVEARQMEPQEFYLKEA